MTYAIHICGPRQLAPGVFEGFWSGSYEPGTKGARDLCGFPRCRKEAFNEQRMDDGSFRGLCWDHTEAVCSLLDREVNE